MKWRKALIGFVILLAAITLGQTRLRTTDFVAGWKILAHLGAPQIAATLLLPFVAYLLSALRWQIILKSLGYRMPIRRLIAFDLSSAAASFAASLFIPTFGVAGRSVQILLLKRYGVSASATLVALSQDIAIGTTVAVLLTASLLLGTGLAEGFLTLNAWYLFLLVFTFFLVLAVIVFPERAYALLPTPLKQKRVVRDFFLQLDEIRNRLSQPSSRMALLQVAATLVISYAFGLAYLAVLIYFIGIPVSLQTLSLIQLAFYSTGIAPVGGIGTLERALSNIFWQQGGQYGIALALMLRFKSLPWLALGFILLAIYGFTKPKTKH
ncbi:MAG: flippase-like domain-containing protein [Parcubacteria group bacterium]|nr:flippase-like domain-containing protein [Parcubacteria group bacterium]